jgi:hypothetical protein
MDVARFLMESSSVGTVGATPWKSSMQRTIVVRRERIVVEYPNVMSPNHQYAVRIYAAARRPAVVLMLQNAPTVLVTIISSSLQPCCNC